MLYYRSLIARRPLPAPGVVRGEDASGALDSCGLTRRTTPRSLDSYVGLKNLYKERCHTMFKRRLGRSGKVSTMGLGCWAIGGPWTYDGREVGWSKVDDDESTRAIHKALDMGITFFDTADCYGCGHSERILGRALQGRRDQVVIATKFGRLFDEETRQGAGWDTSPEYIRRACESSLRRLDTDYIDLYQFHWGDYEGDAIEVREVLEELVAEGKIRAYGWSTDLVDRARIFVEGEHCASVQHALNVFTDAPEILALCEEYDMGSVNRRPLLRGILAGKFNRDSTFPEDDVRHGWDFRSERGARWLAEVEAIREALTQGGRTMAQGALGWIWARSERTIPIPGFKTVAQVEENVRAITFGPLSDEQMKEIEAWFIKAQNRRSTSSDWF